MINSGSDLVMINLSTREITRKPCPGHVIKNYLGGRGLGDYILLKHLGAATGPLDPENILVVASGLLTGSRMITTGRVHVSSRSPLTGLIGTSNSGGMFGSELKLCGILALVITGRSEAPAFIKITGDQITIEDASPAWGLPRQEAAEKLLELAGEKNARAALIGPAGEKLVSLASIMVGPGHACGRTGLGAVMGSKNLKGIVVKKTAAAAAEKVPAEAVRAVKNYLAKLKTLPDWEEWTTLGSTDSVIWTHQLGACGAKNYSQVTFDGIETATGASFKDMIVKYRGCYNCPVRCKATVKIDRGRHKGFEGDRGEYEPLSTWGPKCGNADGLESIYLCNLCDEYGLDSIGAGNAVAFAIDLYERGILTVGDTGGLELTWGNAESMEELLRQIADRSTWLGDALARGMKQAAGIIGRGSEKYTHTVKGLSMTIMDPRGFKGSGLGYAVSNRGADFGYVYAKPEYAYTREQALKAYGTEKAADRLAEEGKPPMVRQCMLANAVVDSLGICKIPEFGMIMDFDLQEAAKLVTAFTGSAVTGEDLLKTGERIVNAERLFNFRYGATAKDDTLPAKFLTEPIKEGPCRGSVVNLTPMLKEFYALMGWQEDGVVGKDKVNQLNLAGLTGDTPLDRLWE
ncbi:aldehyde ferredoxin oxidoreductase family protein [Desulfotruncus alcoholivorax]|uniref:aldehyde ferredoxin oxidoreductase family protein n=1 Tax=Desulfotruncus alcoholivorax TaxID=265477 RepID=UPI001EE5BFA5|nr:aldehyde ferredoxin oxidoreductase family protein [Desulfotruncus alcoholivorax]